MRACGPSVGRCPVAFPRWDIPRDNQHCPRRAPQHTFSDGTLPKAPPAAPPIGSDDNKIRFPRIGMQHDRASGIAVLLDGPHRDTFALGAFTQARQQFEAFALVP